MWCKTFSLKIWLCKILDKYHVCLNDHTYCRGGTVKTHYVQKVNNKTAHQCCLLFSHLTSIFFFTVEYTDHQIRRNGADVEMRTEKDKTFIGMTWLNPSTAESKISEKPKYQESNTSLKMVMFGKVKLKLKFLSSQFYPAPLGSRLRVVFKALLQQSLHPPLFRTVFAEP